MSKKRNLDEQRKSHQNKKELDVSKDKKINDKNRVTFGKGQDLSDKDDSNSMSDKYHFDYRYDSVKQSKNMMKPKGFNNPPSNSRINKGSTSIHHT